ncbi:sensor histidine kinase/response regulator [Alcanivorax hongdengensis A-11-3]|uniref:Sensory/regulatory protein RpfC n=1 Tax=Alcanivorax hongdengensis A-11-3 TaxID=1177179 RepID=L0WG26_9GAMM|nr:ATP-binding protein [Alcanivorax hongdengensis]EKF75669.1 sensor histidine kinase/response regulator [Alcanivorax hongdengensis A-11-3]
MTGGKGIRQQLQILGVVPALIMLGLLLVALTWQRFEDADRDLHELGSFLAQQIASASEYGVLAGNYTDLRRQARLAMQQADLRYVEFRDENGQVLLYEGRNGHSEAADEGDTEVLEFHSGIYRQPAVVEDVADSSVGNQEEPDRIGEVVLGMSSTRLLARQKEIILASLIPALLSVVLGLWIAHYLAGQISAPLSSLSRLVRILRGGDFHVRGSRPLAGEMAELQDDINELASTLESSRRDQQNALRELREAHSQAQSASQAKSEFLAMMSHELRTPMNGVLGMLQLLETTELNSEQQEYALAALESTGHLLDVINDILDFSRIEAGRMDMDPVFFAPLSLLNNCVSTFRYLAENKGLYLRLEGEQALQGLVVRTDPTRLRQILSNLISNAVKFTQQGGITLQVTAEPQSNQRLSLQIEVRDTGIGIAEDKQARLFEAFSQLDSSTSRRYGGTGLGLAIARRLADMLGGTLTLSSEPGQGSTFQLSLYLPFRQDAGERGRELATEESGETALQGRVLLVEDNPVNCLVAKRMLEQLGLTVVVAHDGEEALTIAREQHIDCILMDVQMPVMDGLEATRELRRWERMHGKPSVPIVALTANAMSDERDRCLAAGMNGHLTKPFRRQGLIRVLDPYLRAAPSPPGR